MVESCAIKFIWPAVQILSQQNEVSEIQLLFNEETTLTKQAH